MIGERFIKKTYIRAVKALDSIDRARFDQRRQKLIAMLNEKMLSREITDSERDHIVSNINEWQERANRNGGRERTLFTKRVSHVKEAREMEAAVESWVKAAKSQRQ